MCDFISKILKLFWYVLVLFSSIKNNVYVEKGDSITVLMQFSRVRLQTFG